MQDEGSERSIILASKVEHIDEKDQRELSKELRDSDALAWVIQDLEPANFPPVRSDEFTEATLIHSKALLMPS